MLSKSQIKYITSLTQKKYRQKYGLFFAEGEKVIQEFYNSGWKLHSCYVTEGANNLNFPDIITVSDSEIKKISTLKTPSKAVGVFYIPSQWGASIEGALIVALDGIQDPGNLGTLIRLCDWFGVSQMICSFHTVDCFNPKVVQASMGSLARVEVRYCDLQEYLGSEKDKTIYGTFLNGSSVYKSNIKPTNSVLVLGNEGQGISKEVAALINKKLTIPQFGASHDTESLNVATAAGIFLSEFYRTTEM